MLVVCDGDEVRVCVCVERKRGKRVVVAVCKGWWESRQGVRHQTTSQNKRRPCVSVSVQRQTCGLPLRQRQQQQQIGVWGQAACHRNNMSSASLLL